MRLHDHENMKLRLLPILWLAFILLFAQQGAALHALSHLADGRAGQSQQEKQLPHSPVCDKCMVYAGVAGAATSTPSPFTVPGAVHVFIATNFLPFLSAPLRAYFSRGPPHLVR